MIGLVTLFVIPEILIRLNECLLKVTDLRSFLFSHYKKVHWFDLYFSASVEMLIFFVIMQLLNCPKPFSVPIILSLHILLGFCFRPDSLNPPVIGYGIS